MNDNHGTKTNTPAPVESKTSENAPVLPESLATFEGTPFQDRIVAALEAAGIQDPQRLNPRAYNNYYGLPSTDPEYGAEDKLSPIVDMIYDGLEDETIIEETVSILESLTLPATPEMKDMLSKLALLDTSIFRDAESGEVVAYATGLTSDGGRSGYVILGPNALKVEARNGRHPVTEALVRRLT